MSRRLSGLEPEYEGLQDSSRRRNVTIKAVSEEVPEAAPTNIFSDSTRKQIPASEPIQEREKVTPVAPVAVTEIKDVNPLSRDEILAILSKEMPLEKASIIETFMSKSDIINEEVPSIYSSYFF